MLSWPLPHLGTILKRSKASLWADLIIPNWQREDLWRRGQSPRKSTKSSWHCDGHLPKGKQTGKAGTSGADIAHFISRL